jgi:hypothetical protein
MVSVVGRERADRHDDAEPCVGTLGITLAPHRLTISRALAVASSPCCAIHWCAPRRTSRSETAIAIC